MTDLIFEPLKQHGLNANSIRMKLASLTSSGGHKLSPGGIGGGGVGSGSKRRRPNWSDEETNVLIALWKEHIGELRTVKRNGTVYDKISTRLVDFGFQRTRDEVHTRIANLSQEYRKEKLKVEAEGVAQSDWRFWEPIHYILTTYPSSRAPRRRRTNSIGYDQGYSNGLRSPKNFVSVVMDESSDGMENGLEIQSNPGSEESEFEEIDESQTLEHNQTNGQASGMDEEEEDESSQVKIMYPSPKRMRLETTGDETVETYNNGELVESGDGFTATALLQLILSEIRSGNQRSRQFQMSAQRLMKEQLDVQRQILSFQKQIVSVLLSKNMQ